MPLSSFLSPSSAKITAVFEVQYADILFTAVIKYHLY